MFKKFLLFKTILLLGLLINPVLSYAQTPSVSPTPSTVLLPTNAVSIKSTPSVLTLYRTQEKNSLSVESSFALKEIPSNSIIDSAVLTYIQEGTSSGIIKIINRSNSEVVDSLALGTEGQKNTNRIENLVQKWVVDSTNNYGLIFQNTELEIDNEIILKDIKLDITFSIPDTSKPEILRFDTQVVNSSTLKILWETNEESSVYANFGKTSAYGQTTPSTEEYTTKGSILIGSLNSSISYHIQLVAQDRSKNKTESKNVIFSTSNGPTASTQTQSTSILPPRLLNLEIRNAVDKYVIDLAWSKSENENILGYIVYRNIGDEPYFEVSRVNSDVVRYTDNKIDFGKAYSYYVVAYNATEQSSRSPVQEITIPEMRILGINSIMSQENKTFAVFLIASGLLILISVMYFVKKRIQENINYNEKIKRHSRLHNYLHDPDYYVNSYEEKIINSKR